MINPPLAHGSIICMNEVKPKFPQATQRIWDDCGTFVPSTEADIGAREIEHFVATLLESLVLDFDPKWCKDSLTFRGHLIKKGYL